MAVARKKATKKSTAKRKPAARKKVAAKKKAAPRKKVTAKRKAAPKRKTAAKKKAAPKRKTVARKKAAPKKSTARKTAAGKKTTRKAAPKKKAAKRKPNAAFMRPMTVSDALSQVVGAIPIPRTEVTKKLWAYIKRNKLQDSVNRRMIIADDKLKKVFGGKKKVNMFEMTKLVSKHLK